MLIWTVSFQDHNSWNKDARIATFTISKLSPKSSRNKNFLASSNTNLRTHITEWHSHLGDVEGIVEEGATVGASAEDLEED